jgi:hypothetical protein
VALAARTAVALLCPLLIKAALQLIHIQPTVAQQGAHCTECTDGAHCPAEPTDNNISNCTANLLTNYCLLRLQRASYWTNIGARIPTTMIYERLPLTKVDHILPLHTKKTFHSDSDTRGGAVAMHNQHVNA